MWRTVSASSEIDLNTTPRMRDRAIEAGNIEMPMPAATKPMIVWNCDASSTMCGLKPSRWQRVMR